MEMKHFGIISIVAVLIFVVAISGCTSDVQDKKYSNLGVNFTYPGDMTSNATFIFVTPPGTDIQNDTLGNDKLVISIEKIPITSEDKQYYTFDQFKQLLWADLNNNSATAYTHISAADKSANGTTIYEEIYTSTDPKTGAQLKNKAVAFIKGYGNYYIWMVFQTKAENFDSQLETINKIQNSAVLT